MAMIAARAGVEQTGAESVCARCTASRRRAAAWSSSAAVSRAELRIEGGLLRRVAAMSSLLAHQPR